MKTILIIIGFTFCVFSLKAQEVLISKSQIKMFMSKGVNINQIDLNEYEKNLLVQSALKHHKKQKTIGFIAIPIGIAWLGYSSYIPAKKMIDSRNSDEMIPATTNNTYLMITSSLFTATAIPAIISMVQKTKRDKQIEKLKTL